LGKISKKSKKRCYGYLNGVVSKDYTSILNSENTSDLKFLGSAVPTFFGSVINTFSYKNFELSFNIIYKFGYYFRRTSVNYTQLFAGNYMQADYSKRWQKPGDELKTNVPAIVYPADANSDEFYRLSSVLVDKGDNITFQDFKLGYTFQKSSFQHFPFNSLSIYFYASNLGLIWRANKDHLDPDAISGYPTPKTIEFGLSSNF